MQSKPAFRSRWSLHMLVAIHLDLKGPFSSNPTQGIILFSFNCLLEKGKNKIRLNPNVVLFCWKKKYRAHIINYCTFWLLNKQTTSNWPCWHTCKILLKCNMHEDETKQLQATRTKFLDIWPLGLYIFTHVYKTNFDVLGVKIRDPPSFEA